MSRQTLDVSVVSCISAFRMGETAVLSDCYCVQVLVKDIPLLPGFLSPLLIAHRSYDLMTLDKYVYYYYYY